MSPDAARAALAAARLLRDQAEPRLKRTSSRARRAIAVGAGSILDLGGMATYKAARELAPPSKPSTVADSWSTVGREIKRVMTMQRAPIGR